MQDTAKRTVYYLSPTRGISSLSKQGDKDKELLYYGVVQRYSKAEFEAHGPESLCGALNSILTAPYEDCEVVSEEPVERFECFDEKTGDLLVMWRVPFRRKKAAMH